LRVTLDFAAAIPITITCGRAAGDLDPGAADKVSEDGYTCFPNRKRVKDKVWLSMVTDSPAGPEPVFITVGSAATVRQIAVRRRAGEGCGVFWLGGFSSDMQGIKAVELDAWAAGEGRPIVRFDYSGHGESAGDFRDGTIGVWLEESLAVFERFCVGPQIVVGSSMGGWMALLLAREIRKRQMRGEPSAATIARMVLVAPAVDMTEELMWKNFPPGIRQRIETSGVWLMPSGEDVTPVTRELIEDGRQHLLLGAAIEVGCPLRILQGGQDAVVPWRHALTLIERLPADDVVLTLIQDGDHRLSRPQDLARLIAVVAEPLPCGT